MQTNIYLFHLRFRPSLAIEGLANMLGDCGFKLEKKLGESANTFRNYHFKNSEISTYLSAMINLLPGKDHVTILQISLDIAGNSKSVVPLFRILRQLSKTIHFDLIDTELKHQILSKLQQEGKVDQYFIGLNKQEMMDAEQESIIPLDAAIFRKNETAILKRTQLFNSSELPIQTTNSEQENKLDNQDDNSVLDQLYKWIKR